MKILLVAEKETTRATLLHHLRSRGFDLIHYRNPIKAMDNIDEIEPDIVFFSAEDFPRHWKPFIRLLRESMPMERTSFILLRGEVFSFDEAAKAKHLEVSGIFRENLEDRKEYSRVEEFLTKFSSLDDYRNEQRYIPDESDNVEFVFTHPHTNALVTGSLSDMSTSGAAFAPDNPEQTAAITVGETIRLCSLKVEDEYLSFSATVVRNTEQLGLKYASLDASQISIISAFIGRKAERDLKKVIDASPVES